MRTRRTARVPKFMRFLGPPGVGWLHDRLLPAAGAVYDELAKKHVVERVERRGKPPGRRNRRAPWAWSLQLMAAGDHMYRKRSPVEIGAMVRAALRGTTRRAILDAVKSLPTADERREAKASLRKLGWRYVRAGQKLLRSDEDVPPKTLRSAADRRTDLQAVLLWAVAWWVADQHPQPSRPSGRPYHGILMAAREAPAHVIPLLVGG